MNLLNFIYIISLFFVSILSFSFTRRMLQDGLHVVFSFEVHLLPLYNKKMYYILVWRLLFYFIVLRSECYCLFIQWMIYNLICTKPFCKNKICCIFWNVLIIMQMGNCEGKSHVFPFIKYHIYCYYVVLYLFQVFISCTIWHCDMAFRKIFQSSPCISTS